MTTTEHIQKMAELPTEETHSPAWFIRYNAEAMGVMSLGYVSSWLHEQCSGCYDLQTSEAIVRKLAELRPNEFEIRTPTDPDDPWTEVVVFDDDGEELI